MQHVLEMFGSIGNILIRGLLILSWIVQFQLSAIFSFFLASKLYEFDVQIVYKNGQMNSVDIGGYLFSHIYRRVNLNS